MRTPTSPIYATAHGQEMTLRTPSARPLKVACENLVPRVNSGHVNVAVLDIDRLTILNAQWGRAIVDHVLEQILQRLKVIIQQYGDQASVARIGDDEFLVVAPRVSPPKKWGGELLAQLAIGNCWKGAEFPLAFTVGVCSAVRHAGESHAAFSENILNRATLAMKVGKSEHRGGVTAFRQGMITRSDREHALEVELASALASGKGLSVAYQLCISTDFEGALRPNFGIEALARWEHETLGSLSPGEFIPIAERSSLISRLGEFVLRRACADFRSLRERGAAPTSLAVNVSARQLENKNFPQMVLDCLRTNAIEPGHFQIEITERARTHGARVLAGLNRLRRNSVSVAIDDFGIGYSSIGVLQNVPLDILKIDASFVSALPDCARSKAIVSSIVALARAHHLEVIAEGVESAEQYACLKELGCHFFQGYWFARPLPPIELSDAFAGVETALTGLNGGPKSVRLRKKLMHGLD